jgi:hypothetical protein
MPDLIELTALGSLTIEWCGKLKALPRRFGELGALRELTLCGLDGKLQEMPDLIGLTALGSLTIEYCENLRAAGGISELGVLKQLMLRMFNELQEMPDLIGLTALQHFSLKEAAEVTHLSDTLGRMTALKRLTLCGCSKSASSSIAQLRRLLICLS